MHMRTCIIAARRSKRFKILFVLLNGYPPSKDDWSVEKILFMDKIGMVDHTKQNKFDLSSWRRKTKLSS